MKRQMFLATAFSAAFAVSVAAQNPPSTAQTPSQDKPTQVTLTGCLTQASASPTGTSGTAGTSASPQFVLTNATMGSAPSSATGTSGTGAASSSAMGKSYKLTGSSPDLKDNVNAKVEVKGTIEKASASPSGEPATSASEKDIQTLRVTSVRKIADTCSGQ
jgi:hypothetical protein